MNGSRRNARGEETLRSILQETVKLVGKNGFDGTTINQITKATGKPASSIYWLFSTKDELVAAALESTYQADLAGLRLWPEFDPTQSIEDQLTPILSPSFIARATEDPVRLGLMVALEGSSEGSAARAPFATRRQKMRSGISNWWQRAVQHQGNVLDPEVFGENMTALTIALLDGHYMSDIEAPPSVLAQHQRGEYVAVALGAAFRMLASNEGRLSIVDSSDPKREFQSQHVVVDESPDLLNVVRTLVAEKGYNGATLARICERSGMQRSSVYWRYKDKDHLISAAVSEPFLRLADRILPKDSGGTPGLSSFAFSGATSIKLAMEDRSAAVAGLLLKLQRRVPLVLASCTIMNGLELRLEQMGAELQEHLAKDGDHGELTVDALRWLLHTLWEGLLLGVSFDYVYDVEGLTQILGVMLEEVAGHAYREELPR